jgi:membrane associated rhomboid family serine protease
MMIPLKDENPSFTTPSITVSIIILNCFIFFYQASLGPRDQQLFTIQFGAIPLELASFTRRWQETALSPVPLIFTPITCMFLHGGALHLAGNMLYLWIFGNNVEDRFGHGYFLFFYFVCGLAATVSHVVMDPFSSLPMVGASGAIAGVLGAYFVMFPRARVVTLFLIFIIRVPAILFLGFWFIGQIANAGSRLGNVAWFAHIGGFLAGIFMTAIFSKAGLMRYRRPIMYRPR